MQNHQANSILSVITTILTLTAFKACSGLHRRKQGFQMGTCLSLTFSTNGHQFDSLAADEVQGFIHVGDLVETHLAFVRFGKPFA